MNIEGGWKEALGADADNPPDPRRNGFPVSVYMKCPDCTGTGEMDGGLCRTCGGAGTSDVVESRWSVSSCEARIKAQFESWVQENALRLCDRIEATKGTEHASQFRSTYIGDYSAGYYSWDGRYCRSAKQDVPGVRYLFYLLLRRCHPGVTHELASEIMNRNPGGCGLAIKWALGNSLSPLPVQGSMRVVGEETMEKDGTVGKDRNTARTGPQTMES